jgi:hypothetical protein
MITINCIDCGLPVECKTRHTNRCKSCKIIHRAKYNKELRKTEKHIQTTKNYIRKRNKSNIKHQKWNSKNINDLGDSYLKQRLKWQGFKNPTPEMIEEKRLALKIIRQIKTIKTQLNKQL